MQGDFRCSLAAWHCAGFSGEDSAVAALDGEACDLGCRAQPYHVVAEAAKAVAEHVTCAERDGCGPGRGDRAEDCHQWPPREPVS